MPRRNALYLKCHYCEETFAVDAIDALKKDGFDATCEECLQPSVYENWELHARPPSDDEDEDDGDAQS